MPTRLYQSLFLLVAFVGLWVLSSCSDNTEGVNPYNIDFSWKEPIVDGALQISTSIQNYSGDVNKLSFTWDFGETGENLDSIKIHQRNPLFQYTKYGRYNVKLSVRDESNKIVGVVQKEVNVVFFQNIPSATIDSVSPAVFGFTIRGATHKGEKYEYTDPDPRYLLEIAEDPSFDSLVLIDGTRTYKSLPVNSAYRVDINQLFPGKTYYIRVRTVRLSSFKVSVIEEVSEACTKILKVNTLASPEIQINVDTTSNASLVIIRSSLPGVSVSDAILNVLKDGVTFKPTPLALDVDSIFYREPGSTLKFSYTYKYTHPYYTNDKITLEKSVDISTPNSIIHYDTTILRSNQTYELSQKNTQNVSSHRFIQTDIGITIQWNHAPIDAGPFLSPDPISGDLYFFKRSNNQDAYSYLTLSFNEVSYYHESDKINPVGVMQVYKEDNEYIYMRMIQAQDSRYRTGFQMRNDFSSGSQQSTRIIYFKGFLLKLKKGF